MRLKLMSVIRPRLNIHNLFSAPINSKCRNLHIPVMKSEIVEFLSPLKTQIFVDMTFGSGGHSKAILASAQDVVVYALDRDPHAHEIAIETARDYDSRLVPLLGRFSQLPALLHEKGVELCSVDGFLIDAGCSSMQLNEAERGFSFNSDGPLDMRMDGKRLMNQPTAADVVNSLDSEHLAKIFKVYGEEKKAKKVAQAIVEARFMMKELRSTGELAQLVASVIGSEIRLDKLQRVSHPATKVFQALRIFVNNELNELNYAMEVAYRFLRPGGRLATLSFHSLEDRIIKRHLLGVDMDEPVSSSISQRYRNAGKWHTQSELDEMMPKRWQQITKHVILPSEDEIAANSRSRSAKFRAAVKL